jgi:hypothetical protein
MPIIDPKGAYWHEDAAPLFGWGTVLAQLAHAMQNGIDPKLDKFNVQALADLLDATHRFESTLETLQGASSAFAARIERMLRARGVEP